MEPDDIMTMNSNMDTCSPTEEKISDEQTISCANVVGYQPCTQIKHIVISGGGVTGFSFYGILRDTHRKWIMEIREHTNHLWHFDRCRSWCDNVSRI